MRQLALNMAFVSPQRKDVPHSYGSDAVTKQLILAHISNTNDRKLSSMQVMLIKENSVHTPSEDPDSQPLRKSLSTSHLMLLKHRQY
jgi:hypothetical protein